MSQDLTTQGQPPTHIQQLLTENGMSYDADSFKSMSLEDHAEQGFKGLKVSVLAAVHAGMHFSACRDLDKKFIAAETERLGISKRTIYNMIDVYELFKLSPEKLCRRLQSLGVYKLIELKHFTEEDLSDFSEGKEVYGLTIEVAETCSVRELKSISNEHKAQLKNAKQKLLDMENRLDTEAELSARLFEENQRLKSQSPERIQFTEIRKQLFADMETAQGIIARARKTFDTATNYQQEIEKEALEDVIHPLLHMLGIFNGGSKLLADDCYERWGIDPSIPSMPPLPNTLTHEEKWKAEETARRQASVTDAYLPKRG